MLKSEHNEWLYFDLVPEEYEIRKGQPTYTGRFCVIGSKLNEQKLKELFAGRIGDDYDGTCIFVYRISGKR